ncbi:MAG: 3-keto-5-aminohexanoate cleavage protein [Promethearchaeati archaeon SRVP18_Atabeyarchaeia-1]
MSTKKVTAPGKTAEAPAKRPPRKVIITCALTGSATVPSQTPYLPITPDQISDEAKAAYKAGASVVHVHVRDPKTGLPSADLKVWKETLTKIKQKCDDLVVCTTTGGGMGMTPEQRIAVVPEFEPEMCSFDIESMNFSVFPLAERIKEWKTTWEKSMVESSKDMVFRNTFKDLDVFAKAMREHKVKPELELYGTNGLWNTAAMLRFGWVEFPLHIQYVLGVLGGTAATVYELVHLQTETDRIARQASLMLGRNVEYTWSVIGIGYPAEFHLGAAAMAMGGHVRVGLEDNIYVRHHELAKGNGELVEKIVKIAHDLDYEIATPKDTREILKLKGIDKVKF